MPSTLSSRLRTSRSASAPIARASVASVPNYPAIARACATYDWKMRRTCLLIALIAVLLIDARPADAALFLRFEPQQARPGEIVVARTGGRGAAPDAAGQELPVFFVPADRSSVGPTSEWAVQVGLLVVDEFGDGFLEFQVPEIDAGNYDVHLDCGVCTPDDFPYAGEFKVESVAAGASLPVGWIMVGVGAALAALAAATARSRGSAPGRP